MAHTLNYRRLKFFRNLRTTLYATVLGLGLLLFSAILYLNATGMPEAWRRALEVELSKQGLETSIKRLRYVPLRGIEATEVEVFVDASRTKRLAFLQRLIFDLDKTKAMRGIIRLTHIDLLNAELRLPVDPDEPEGDVINIKNLNGQVLLSKSRKFEVRQGKGLIDGIQLKIDAVILGFRPVPVSDEKEQGQGMHRRFLREFVKEINQWQLDPAHPPELALKVEADATKWAALKCQFTFRCEAARRGQIDLRDVEASGNVIHSLVSVHHFGARDDRGNIRMALDYDLAERRGNFDFDSTLDAPHWIYDLTGKRLLDDFSLAEAPELQMRGQFSFPADAPMELAMQGRMATKNVLFRGSPLSAMSTEFSYRNQDFFLRNLKLSHPQGELTGHMLQRNGILDVLVRGDIPLNIVRPFYRDLPVAAAVQHLESQGEPKIKAVMEARFQKNESYSLQQMKLNEIVLQHPRGHLTGNVEISGNLVNYDLESTFPADIGQRFFSGQALEKVLGDFTGNADTRYWVSLRGKLDRADRTAWAVQGRAKLENVSYRGVPVFSCATSMDLKHQFLRFTDIDVEYDYSQYELQKIHQGGLRGPVRAASITYDHAEGMVKIEQLRGNVHPVPLLNMFATNVADAVEEYRFHVPPALSAEGSIDVRNKGRTQFKVSLQQAKAMTWEFLGEPTIFSDVSSEIQIDSEKVLLTRLNAVVFGGKCAGTVRVMLTGDNRFDADVRWNQLRMAAIAETHKFKEKGYGTLTGWIALKGSSNTMSSLEGEGMCALEKGELFAVPIFGPLSSVMSAVVGDRRAGFERAKDAFCNFTIRKGVIETHDFVTHTTSLKFTGNGKVDLNQKTIDMTMRMNARGLLGIVVLPFQPIIKGLFQFHGQGPMDQPKWEHVVFTSPPEQEKDALLKNTPLRAVPIPE